MQSNRPAGTADPRPDPVAPDRAAEATPRSAATAPPGTLGALGTAPPVDQQWWPGTPVRLGQDDELTLAAVFASADLPTALAAPIDTAPGDEIAIELMTSAPDLASVVALRRHVYSRHARPMLIDDEPIDRAPRTAVLGVRSRSGPLFATMRVSFSADGGEPWLDKYQIPERYRGDRLASFERLAIAGGGRQAIRAKQLLFKAAYLLTIGSAAERIVISTVPPLNRLFESIGFASLFDHGEPVQLDWFGVPQHVLAMAADDHAIALLNANRQWYDLIVTRDRRLESVLVRYFSSREPKADAAIAPG